MPIPRFRNKAAWGGDSMYESAGTAWTVKVRMRFKGGFKDDFKGIA